MTRKSGRIKSGRAGGSRTVQISDSTGSAHGAARVARWVLPGIVGATAFLAFYPALDAKFVNLDDNRLFVENRSYRGFEWQHLRWMFTTTFMGHYQPVTWLSSAMDYAISGDEPSSYHRNNLVLHGLNAVLLYFVAIRLLTAAHKAQRGWAPAGLRLGAALAALLFAIHPLRVESVAWASERRDVLSVFFLLMALLAYLRASRLADAKARSIGWFAVSWMLLVLSLLSKAWGMSFVVLVTILDVYPLRRLPADASVWFRRESRSIWIQKIPYLLLGSTAAVVAGFAQRSALDTMKTLDEWGLTERLIQAFYGLGFYVSKTIWPSGLAVMYELPYELDPWQARYVLSIVAVLSAAGVIVAVRRRLPALLAAGCVYVVTLMPVLGLAQSGPQFVADRYSYVSCIGWALLGGGLLTWIWHHFARPHIRCVSAACGCTLLAICFYLTWQQTKVWRNSEALWQHAIAAHPSSIAHLNYGILLRARGQVDEAIEHYDRAVQIKPDAGNTWFALANARKQKRQYAEAEVAYREAVKFMTRKQSGYLNLGNLYYNNLRRVDDAIAAYRDGIEYMEAHRKKLFTPTLYLALGIALRQNGDLDAAREALEVAARYRSTKEHAKQHLREMVNE